MQARLRDDILCPWNVTLDQLLEFDKFLNSLDPSLKFEIKYYLLKLEFLDILTYKKNRILHTMVYSKPCDPHAYLLPTSYHPIHICESIPFTVLRHVKMICSEPEMLEHCTKQYIFYLHERGYSETVINKALSKLENITRDDMINKKCTNETHQTKCNKCYPFVMKYNVKLLLLLL